MAGPGKPADSAASRHRLDAWERRELPALAVLPYLMIAFCALIIGIVRHDLGAGWAADLGLCGLALAWLLAGTAAGVTPRTIPGALGEGPGRGRAWASLAFFAGLIAIMTVMVARTGWFGFFTFTGYIYVAQLPAAWMRGAGVVAVAALTGSAQAGGFATAAHGPAGAAVYGGAVGVNVIVASGFVWFGWVGSQQSERRARLVRDLSQANQRLEASMAENAVLHSRLVSKAREAGVVGERQRMAREIHDTLAQGLTGIITQLEAAEQAAEQAERDRHYAAAKRLARESLTEARRSVNELRPEPLEDARLIDALAEVTHQWSALNDVTVQLSTTGTGRPLPLRTEVVLLRVAQEALANTARHAAAAHAWVTLSYMDCEVALDVRDDGLGFDPARVAPSGGGPDDGGFGLMAMRQRVEGVSGTLQVESEPGGGTVISACVPAAGAGDGAS